MSSPTAKVMRDNNIHIVNASDVTVGDIVLVEQGDIVCADGRLVSCASLQVNESSLTGESNGIDKFTEMLTGEKYLSATGRIWSTQALLLRQAEVCLL